MDAAPYWVPIATLVGGLVGGFFADFFLAGLAEKRRREIAGREFQRQTLIELQDSVDKLATATRLLHREDLRFYEETGHWPTGDHVPPGLEEYHRALQDADRLRTRLLDWDLMVEVNDFENLCKGATIPLYPGGRDEQVKEMTSDALDKAQDMHLLLNEHLGEAIREML